MSAVFPAVPITAKPTFFGKLKIWWRRNTGRTQTVIAMDCAGSGGDASAWAVVEYDRKTKTCTVLNSGTGAFDPNAIDKLPR